MELIVAAEHILEAVRNELICDLNNFKEWDPNTIEALIAKENPHHKKRLREEFFCAGPLEPLLSDESVTEILLNNPTEIWFERAGRLYKHEDQFLTETTYRNFFSRIFQDIQNETTLNAPAINGEWRGHRVHITAPPLSRNLALSLRKHALTPWTINELFAKGWCDEASRLNLVNLFSQRRNILIVGSTGSGKTSVLGALLQLAETRERIVILEDTRELRLPNTVSTQLLTREDSKGLLTTITLQDLVRHSLRMRPDRLVLGEVRGNEAKDLLLALATGHEGSLGTLHAATAQEAIIRLEMLIQLGAPQWSLQAIRKLIQLSLHYIIVVARSREGKRYLEGIYKIVSAEDFGITLEKTEPQATFLKLDRTAPI